MQIVRNPHDVFASTMHMWMSMFETAALQAPAWDQLAEFVFGNFTRMHERVEATRQLVAAGRFYELRYEDLIAHPLGQIEHLHDHLGLGALREKYRARLEAYLCDLVDYKPNAYEISEDVPEEIRRRWLPYMCRYGYDIQQSAQSAQRG